MANESVLRLGLALDGSSIVGVLVLEDSPLGLLRVGRVLCGGAVLGRRTLFAALLPALLSESALAVVSLVLVGRHLGLRELEPVLLLLLSFEHTAGQLGALEGDFSVLGRCDGRIPSLLRETFLGCETDLGL